jgi:DNA-binding transcriptional MerR regulator
MGPSAAARATGVSTDTLRHYEKLGLLLGVTRSANGYRRYSDEAVRRVLLIQRAIVVGFSLEDLRRILAIRDRGGAPCQGVRTLVAEKLNALDTRLAELQDLREDLGRLLKTWDRALAETPSGQPAHLLESLGTRQPIERARRRRTERSAKDPERRLNLTARERLR